MKILIMGFTKIKYMPYMNFYLDNISDKGNEIHILYWNRDLKNENTEKYSDCVLHEFKCYQEDDVSKLSKINSFAKYRKFAVKLLKKEKFEFIFVLHSLTGVLIADYLKKHYQGKYIFDYRDSTYEGFKPFKDIIGGLVKGAYATFVSSDGFRRFFPSEYEKKIYTSHNLLQDSLNHRNEKQLYGVESEKIRIAFWGFIRHEEINKKLIKKISQDARFELHYYGREQRVAINLKEYVKEIGADNIFFHGEYKPEDRYEFVRNTDIIHNVYKDSNTMLAMGNKYYDAVIFYLPLMSIQDSFMADMAEKAGIGFTVDPYEDNFTDKLYDMYCNMNQDDFYQNCDKELDRVLREYQAGKDVILSIMFSGEGRK